METKLLSSIAVGVAVIVAAWFVSTAWERTHPMMEKIKVTGMAQKDFMSDLIVWEAAIERKAFQIQEAYPLIKNDATEVKAYLDNHGIKDSEVTIEAINISKTYRSVYVNNRYTDEFDGYRLVQRITVESKDIEKVEKVGREITELLNRGMELTSQAPRYYYTKLGDLKIDLLSRASADGQIRAEAIARNGGGSLGGLQRAEMGIFQITAQNSDEEYTWGGAFNTSDKLKTASITVRMEFGVR